MLFSLSTSWYHKWSEVLECVYYYWFTVMQFVCGLLYSVMSAVWFVSFALCCVLIPGSIFFIIRFMFVFLFCMFCFLFCVLSLLMYIVVSFLSVCKFTDHRHRVETQLQLMNIISYHIIPNQITHRTRLNLQVLAGIAQDVSLNKLLLYSHSTSASLPSDAWGTTLSIFRRPCRPEQLRKTAHIE